MEDGKVLFQELKDTINRQIENAIEEKHGQLGEDGAGEQEEDILVEDLIWGEIYVEDSIETGEQEELIIREGDMPEDGDIMKEEELEEGEPEEDGIGENSGDSEIEMVIKDG